MTKTAFMSAEEGNRFFQPLRQLTNAPRPRPVGNQQNELRHSFSVTWPFEQLICDQQLHVCAVFPSCCSNPDRLFHYTQVIVVPTKQQRDLWQHSQLCSTLTHFSFHNTQENKEQGNVFITQIKLFIYIRTNRDQRSERTTRPQTSSHTQGKTHTENPSNPI